MSSSSFCISWKKFSLILCLNQAKETPAGAVCDVICDLVSIDVATEQL